MSDSQIEYLRRYYNMLFPEKLKDNEYVCLFMMKTDENGDTIKFHKFVKSFNQYVELVNRYKRIYNVFNALSTVKSDRNGQLGRVEGNMRQRRVLYIDFDKKDYPDKSSAQDFSKMIKDKLPDLFLHAYYDSGHGYHFYIIIPPTCDNRKVTKLNKELSSLVGADVKACKVTQVARIPCTFNMKERGPDGRYPMVKEIDHFSKHLYQVNHYHQVKMDYLKRSIDASKNRSIIEELPEQPFKEWKYDTGDLDIKQYPCLCAEKAFHEGSDKTERNVWLGRIIAWLKREGYLDYKIMEKCQDWNSRCRPPKSVETTRKEVEGWLKWIDEYGMAKISGCYWNVNDDDRVRSIVEKQCDKFHCKQAINTYTSLYISEDAGVRMNQKVLTDGKLSNKGEHTMSGYEYLILTVLDKYMPTNARTPFTVKNLKYRMQWKKSGKWQLCMDLSTFKTALADLERHKCIKVSDPTASQCSKKNPTYDDKVIKLTRSLKDMEAKGYIEFYYSVARAFICHQITQNEYKVYLCILSNLKNSRSCTLESMDDVLNMGVRNILRSIENLEKASCLRIDRMPPNEKGKKYNLYHPIDTDKYTEQTDVEWSIKLIA